MSFILFSNTYFVLLQMQKEVQEKGFTKPNVDQLIKETSLDKMKKFDSISIYLYTILHLFHSF